MKKLPNIVLIIYALPLVSAFLLVFLIAVLPDAFMEKHSWIGKSLILVCVISLLISFLSLIISAVWRLFKSTKNKEAPMILDDGLSWSKQELSEEEIEKELEKLYPIVFKDKLPEYLSFVAKVHEAKEMFIDTNHIDPLSGIIDDGNYLAATLFYEYANKYQYLISFYEEDIAEDDTFKIYDYICHQLGINILNFESIITERTHNDGYDIIVKQVIAIEKYLDEHTSYSLFIHNEEFLYHLFVAKKQHKEQLLSMKFPNFWDISKLKTS